jgi:Lrp/AsnC family leucine-responsive transcriptional regulator
MTGHDQPRGIISFCNGPRPELFLFVTSPAANLAFMSADTVPPVLDDAIDEGIVRAMSVDARATLADLSAEVGLSVSAVQARLRRLEARGVITGYRALVEPAAVGKPLAAFIEITPLDPGQPDNAPELLEHLAEIEACHSVAGNASYMLLVRVASPRRLEGLIREIRTAASVSTRTTVVLQTFYENRPILPA